MEKLKLGFADMWGYAQYDFNPTDNYFTDLFSQKFDVTIDNKSPDILVYSVYGKSHQSYNCKKIFICGENLKFQKSDIPHYTNSDINLSQYDEDDKDILFPLFLIGINWFNKPQPRPLPSNPTYMLGVDQIQNNRERFITERKFCSFVSNRSFPDRVSMFKSLSNFDRVDSLGGLMNNVGRVLGGAQQEKIEALKNYKFNIAFENSYHDGYITEKVLEPLGAGCIPLYYGGSKVKKFFNSNSFVYRQDFNSEQEYIDYILEINNNDKLYRDMVVTPPLTDYLLSEFNPKIILEKIMDKLK